MGISCKHTGALLVMAVSATAASADPLTFDVSGFGTAAATYADTTHGEFVRDKQPTGADKNFSFNVDSLAGVQSTAHFTQEISASVQLLLRRTTTEDFSLDVPVAFVKDQLTQDVAVRAGRLPLPLFMISDYREVGFANTFLRPPQEVYGAAPLYTLQGIDALYTHSFGGIDVNAQLFYGTGDLTLPDDVSLTFKRALGGNLSLTYGPLTLRYGRFINRLTINSPADQVIDAVAAAGFTDLARELSAKDRATSFTGFGASLDWHNLLVQAETTDAVANGFQGSTRGQYGLLGYRIRKFTPYVMYSARKILTPTRDSTIPAAGALAPLAAGVNAILAKYDQHSLSAGIRWDFRDSMDVKLQVDHVSFQGPGMFANVQPGFSSPVNVAGLAVDFVF